ncbi:protein crumbs homolog 1-like isoform X2 [Pocillopora verrucosa]|uniref:protein crumbs homolog 1-like isoform X2 n=1 Tax=Pocillopora verrucosa TaxID=203993 RepID=UPI00333F6C50
MMDVTELTIAMQGSTFHRSPTSHISYGNFRRDAFHYLQAENLTSVMVENESECIFLCVEETKCYSLNLAVYPDSKGLHLCELLATDKYKAAKHFLANDTFHHHRPWSPCESAPCKNSAGCITDYELNSYHCNCEPGFFGTHCERGESGIRSSGDFCVAPNRGGCSPPDGSYLIFTKKDGTACNATDQIFILDQDGVIYHKCSTKKVCPQDNNPTKGKKLMLKDECHLNISRHVRLPTHNNLKNLKNNFCVHPDGGWPRERIQLVYWPGCGEERLKLNFFELGASTA